MIDWNNINPTDSRLIHECVKRAVKTDPSLDVTTMNMDLMAVHIITPLRLNDLLSTDDSNFYHDIYGIRRHVDRDSGNLLDCFLPRFAV